MTVAESFSLGVPNLLAKIVERSCDSLFSLSLLVALFILVREVVEQTSENVALDTFLLISDSLGTANVAERLILGALGVFGGVQSSSYAENSRTLSEDGALKKDPLFPIPGAKLGKGRNTPLGSLGVFGSMPLGLSGSTRSNPSEGVFRSASMVRLFCCLNLIRGSEGIRRLGVAALSFTKFLEQGETSGSSSLSESSSNLSSLELEFLNDDSEASSIRSSGIAGVENGSFIERVETVTYDSGAMDSLMLMSLLASEGRSNTPGTLTIGEGVMLGELSSCTVDLGLHRVTDIEYCCASFLRVGDIL